MTNTDHMRSRLLERAGLAEVPPAPFAGESYESLRRSEWSPVFEEYMRNRLIMGALRYGKINHGQADRVKRQYDRAGSIKRRLEKYMETGNKELLVDCANLCLLEFVECHHPKAHFHAADDTAEHVATV